MPDCKQYGGITRGELDNLREDLAKEGISIPSGDDVMVQGPYGIQLRATYNEDKETLKICITKKPFYIPESEVWKIVDTGTAPTRRLGIGFVFSFQRLSPNCRKIIFRFAGTKLTFDFARKKNVPREFKSARPNKLK